MLRKLAYFLLGACMTLGVSWAAQLPLPGGGTGPQLGDLVSNIYLLTQSYVSGQGFSATTGITAKTTAGQTNCTQLNDSRLQQITATATAATAYVCLPRAFSGRIVYIANGTGQTVDLYSSATPATGSTVDTINTVAGGTAYTSLTTHISTTCFAPADGKWFCVTSG